MDTDHELVWTAEAKDMLMKIFDGLTGCDPKIAASVVRGIYAKTQVLLKSPEIGWHFKIVPERDVRVLLYGHYRIAYEFTKPVISSFAGCISFPVGRNLRFLKPPCINAPIMVKLLLDRAFL